MTTNAPQKPAPWKPPVHTPGPISDGTLTLRPYVYEDAAALWAGVEESRDALNPWMPWARDYARPEDASYIIGRAIRSARDPLDPANNAMMGYLYGIFDATNGEYLGGTGFNRIDAGTHNAETGYWVRASRQRRGVASGALRLMLSLGFTPQERGGFGFRRVHIFAGSGNVASCGVPAKVGLRRSMHARADRWVEGLGWCDTIGWDVLAGEWDWEARRVRA